MLKLDLIEFIETSIRSLDELHALVTCAREPERWWDAPALCAETGMPAAVADQALENLARRNLLDVRIGGTLRYQFSPASSGLQASVIDLLDAYYKNPVAITRTVAASRNRYLRDFSDAFRIRRDDTR
jgi:hypothetical protein